MRPRCTAFYARCDIDRRRKQKTLYQWTVLGQLQPCSLPCRYLHLERLALFGSPVPRNNLLWRTAWRARPLCGDENVCCNNWRSKHGSKYCWCADSNDDSLQKCGILRAIACTVVKRVVISEPMTLALGLLRIRTDRWSIVITRVSRL